MLLGMQPRQWLLGGVLVLSLGLTAWMATNDDADELLVDPTAAAPVRTKARAAGAGHGPELRLPSLIRTAPQQIHPASDLFAAHSWYVPPPAPPVRGVAAEPVSPPVAPPVPYSYMGKLEDAPEGTLFMLTSGNNKVYTVRLGETLDGTWRLDREDSNSLHFTYTPLALSKALAKASRPVNGGQNNTQGTTG